MKVQLQAALRRTKALGDKQPRRRKGIPKEITAHDKTIKDLGRQYAVMICPWIDPAFFGHKGRPIADPSSPDRFITKLSQHEASIAELYDFVPQRLHALMENHSHFGDLVSGFIILPFIVQNFSSFDLTPEPCDQRQLTAFGSKLQ